MSDLPSCRFLADEVRLANHVEIGEERQGPVHRRQVDRLVDGVNPPGDLICSEMLVGLPQHLPHAQTRTGDTVSTAPQSGDEFRLDIHSLESPSSLLRIVRN